MRAPCRTPARGHGWEAVRVSRFYGLKALERLVRPGAVAVDPAPPGLVFFVEPGPTNGWPLSSELVRVIPDFTVPPTNRQTPPGAYWLVPPKRGGVGLTDHGALEVLTKALDVAVGDQAGCEAEEGFMDVVASFPSDAQSAKAVQPGDRALDHVAEDAKAGAVWLTSFGDDRRMPRAQSRRRYLSWS